MRVIHKALWSLDNRCYTIHSWKVMEIKFDDMKMTNGS